jgi:hypothetical protein
VAPAMPAIVCAETIGVFFDPDVEQIIDHAVAA